MTKNLCVKCGAHVERNKNPYPTDKPSARIICDTCWKSFFRDRGDDQKCSDEMDRHPIGVEPKYIWEAQRAISLREAIIRYLEADMKIPIEWITEYNELAERTCILFLDENEYRE